MADGNPYLSKTSGKVLRINTTSSPWKKSRLRSPPSRHFPFYRVLPEALGRPDPRHVGLAVAVCGDPGQKIEDVPRAADSLGPKALPRLSRRRGW